MQSCRGCGTVFTARLPDPGEATDYGGYYRAENLEVPPFVHRRLAQIVASFEGHRRLGRWLDVGSGAGTLMAAARGKGWDVVGTEVAEVAAAATRARGLDVRVGDLGELGLPDASFDVVSMLEVVEHVSNAQALLAAAHSLLRPGGVLYVTTPNGRGISGRLLRMEWSVVSPPEHLQLFSLRGLRIVLRGSGFAVRTAQTHGLNPHELLHALRSREVPATAPSRVETSYRLNESLSSTRAGAMVKRAANAALGASRLGDSIKVLAQRQS